MTIEGGVPWPAGEVAFVTGAASGIGLGIARAFAASGAKVALADIDRDRAQVASAALNDAGADTVALELDVCNHEAWRNAADAAEAALGPVSIVCNNAGVSGVGPISEIDPEVWRWVFRVNTESQFLSTSVFLPRFRARGGRTHLMNTASMAGLVPIANTAAYNASKFASVGFTLTVREEVRGSGIRVSLLLPGTVATRLSYTARTAEAKLVGKPADTHVIEKSLALLSQGADPDRVGEQVVEAMRDEKFLILTHADWLPLVKRLHGEIDRAYAELEPRHGDCPGAQALLTGPSPVAY